MEVQGKVAVVTGGAVRLGKALVLALARAGAAVVVHYGRSAEAARETAAEARSLGVDVLCVQVDLMQPRRAREVIAAAVERFGRADILVNSAAIFQPGGLADTTEEDWDRHFHINLKSPFFLCQAFAAQVPKGRRGHIVNIVDWRGVRPGADYLAYRLSKAALIALTQNLALALAPGIQVNAIAPGAILPPPGENQAYLDALAVGIPARRPGAPEDVAQALLYLLRSDFVTGEVLFVTGGQHLL